MDFTDLKDFMNSVVTLEFFTAFGLSGPYVALPRRLLTVYLDNERVPIRLGHWLHHNTE